jgi:hypothetical protein
MKLKKFEGSLELEEFEQEMVDKIYDLFKENGDKFKLKSVNLQIKNKSGYIINFYHATYDDGLEDVVFFKMINKEFKVVA